jgi:hypothetical protein
LQKRNIIRKKSVNIEVCYLWEAKRGKQTFSDQMCFSIVFLEKHINFLPIKIIRKRTRKRILIFYANRNWPQLYCKQHHSVRGSIRRVAEKKWSIQITLNIELLNILPSPIGLWRKQTSNKYGALFWGEGNSLKWSNSETI